MLDEKLVGQLMGALASLQNTVAQQTAQIDHLAKEVMQLRAIVNRLPCNSSSEQDTNPECLQSARAQMRSFDDDEPNSALIRQMELRASKSGIDVKGPSVMVLALSTVIGMVIAAWVWVKSLPH